MRIQGLLRKNPFIRIVAFYSLGILLASVHSQDSLFYPVFLGIMLAMLILLCILWLRLQLALSGIVISIALILLGFCGYKVQNSFAQLPVEKMEYQGWVIGQPIEKENSYQVDCQVNSINSKAIGGNGEACRLYLRKSDKIAHVLPGDSIKCYTALEPIKNRGIPKEFDYARYMKIQGILYTGFVDSDDFHLGGNSGKLPIRRVSGLVQRKIIDQFRQINLQQGELGVLSALVAGERNLLPDETRESYASAGAMHILAVSGLHVGILFLFLNLVFSDRNQNINYRIFRLLIILGVLWFYAFVTGLSPSVLRATIMFSLFNIGRGFKLSVSSYNLLAASALLILIWNPNQLFMAGFQFSYLAVFGILHFQPRLQKLFTFNNLFADRTWQLITVGIAAQLTTFPLSLYYFHQFPVYFWLTNLFIIPLVWAIMMLTVIFSLSLPLPQLAKTLGFALGKVVQFNNYLVEQISDLPGAVIANIRFEPYHLILFGLMVFILLFLRKREIRLLVPMGLLAAILLLSLNISINKKQQQKKELWVYSTHDGLSISRIDGSNHIFISNLQKSSGNEAVKPFINFWRSRNILKNMKYINLSQLKEKSISDGNFRLLIHADDFILDAGNISLAYYKNISENNSPQTDGVTPDYLLIDRASGFPAPKKLEAIKPQAILLHNSLPSYLEKKWIEFARERTIAFINLKEHGSYKLTLE